MTIVAFAGPSVPATTRRLFPSLAWHAPAEAGDLLALAPGPTGAVCLIDGYFDHRPAVRHKEILLLLAEGVPVYGAASIGALRAAEMATLGMVGVGAIYRAYASGRIVGDDEVALIHAGAQWDWRALSVPLVDVRATLCRAVRLGVLSAAAARNLLHVARSCHYADRSWEGLLAGAALPEPALDELRAWLPGNRVDQKSADALACLKAAMVGKTAGPRLRPKMVRTPFVDSLARERALAPRPQR